MHNCVTTLNTKNDSQHTCGIDPDETRTRPKSYNNEHLYVYLSKNIEQTRNRPKHIYIYIYIPHLSKNRNRPGIDIFSKKIFRNSLNCVEHTQKKTAHHLSPEQVTLNTIRRNKKLSVYSMLIYASLHNKHQNLSMLKHIFT